MSLWKFSGFQKTQFDTISVSFFMSIFLQRKAKTAIVKNNGFNPLWKENFSFPLRCPELAILRFSVKDFDSASSNDFVGEFSIPVLSIRPGQISFYIDNFIVIFLIILGYSNIRLNTKYKRTPDEAALIFIKTAFT